MDALILAATCSLAFGVSALLWNLWVRPELVLALLDDAMKDAPLAGRERRPPLDPRALTLLRWALGGVVVLVGFLAGAVLVILARTPPSG